MMKETEVRRTETDGPGVHSVRETTTTTKQPGTLPNIVGSGLRTRGYGRDHIITKQQLSYVAPIALAILLALTLLYLRSHSIFPFRHTPTWQEKVADQYNGLSDKAAQSAKEAARYASEKANEHGRWAADKASDLAKDSAEWIKQQELKEKASESWESVKENLGEYADSLKESLHLGKSKAEERAREAANRGYATRAKEWVNDKVSEASDSLGNKVGSVGEGIKHRVEELREDARHAAEIAKEEARHAAAQKTYEAGETYNNAKVKAHDSKRSFKDKVAEKISEHL